MVDLGCGLASELRYLASEGWRGLGVDLSVTALEKARSASPGVRFVCADVRRVPLSDGWADALLDRGCFHYLAAADRSVYVDEAARVLKPGGRLLLRACLPHEVDDEDMEDVVRASFRGWRIHALHRGRIAVNRGTLGAVVARLERSTRKRSFNG